MTSVKILKALADETRLKLAKHVAKAPGQVASHDVISSCSGILKLSQPAISHHYSKLVEAGVLIVHKQGTENFYEFNHDLCEKLGIDITKL